MCIILFIKLMYNNLSVKWLLQTIIYLVISQLLVLLWGILEALYAGSKLKELDC